MNGFEYYFNSSHYYQLLVGSAKEQFWSNIFTNQQSKPDIKLKVTGICNFVWVQVITRMLFAKDTVESLTFP